MKQSKFSYEIEHLTHLIAFQTGVCLTYKEKSFLKKNILDKFSYENIITGVLELPRLSSPIIAVSYLSKEIVKQIKNKEDKEANLKRINDLLEGLRGKAHGRK